MAGLAQVTLIGHTGRDPEMSYTPEGVAVTKFSVAVSTKRAGKESTTWYNCTAWRRLAEMINEHCTKGQQVFIQGDFQPREYTGRDGQPRTSLDVTVGTFQFVGGRPAGSAAPQRHDDDDLGDLGDHPF